MKYDYDLVSEADDTKFVNELKRMGQKGFRVIKMFEVGINQKAILEKSIYEPDDRKPQRR